MGDLKSDSSFWVLPWEPFYSVKRVMKSHLKVTHLSRCYRGSLFIRGVTVGAFLFGKANHEESVEKSNYLVRQF